MNVSYRWLRALAPTIRESPQEIADRLGMLGAPADEVTELGEGLDDVLIARVEEVRPHPDADRLRVCTVDAGGEALQVVCGAPNVEAGGYYPFVPVGASLPGGIQIRKAKLRGQVSEGMLCSARELGLGRDHTGLMRLSGEWVPGSSFLEQLALQDTRLVLDITPNRPDLLSHLGVARELAPGGAADLVLEPFSPEPPRVEYLTEHATEFPVRLAIEDPGDCPRYIGAVIAGVRVAPSPEWLATRLRAIGVRPINNVVDATNYVLHELGQPLHAFDSERLSGPEIVVRRARPGETLRTLDGVERAVGEETLVIADSERPVALAGVMGGEETEVTAATTHVLIECALFEPRLVRRTARKTGLSSDASHRFERGVDPEGQRRAVERVADLIVAVAGGAHTLTALDLHPAPRARSVLAVRPARVGAVLGVTLPPSEIGELLSPIGFAVRGGDEVLQVEIPPYRPDVAREIDVVEEIARRRGYDSFDAEAGGYRPGTVPSDSRVALQHRLHELFGRWGFLEARTAAFSPAAENRVPLLNPLSAEESHLRDDLLTGLLRRVEHNWARGNRAIRLYEVGTVFRPSAASTVDEEMRIAAVFTGPSEPPHWSRESRSFDIWDLKALLEEVGMLLGTGRSTAAGEPVAPIFASGEAILLDRHAGQVGHGGRIDEGAVDAPPWADALWGLEVSLPSGLEAGAATFAELPSLPAVERDLALIVDARATAGELERVIRNRAGDLLETVWPFDVYEGKGLPEGSRSVAWRLRFRHPQRTLTDAEVEAAVESVLRGLQEELGVRRR